MNPKDLSDEYKSIKAYCRKEASKSFKHPMAKQEEIAEEQKEPGDGDAEHDLNDEELEQLLA